MEGNSFDGDHFNLAARREVFIGKHRPGAIADADVAAAVFQRAVESKTATNQLLAALVKLCVGGALLPHAFTQPF